MNRRFFHTASCWNWRDIDSGQIALYAAFRVIQTNLISFSAVRVATNCLLKFYKLKIGSFNIP